MPPTPGTNRDDPNRHQGENEDMDSMDSPQFIIAAGSSEEDSDDEIGNNGGYQMLPQDPGTLDSDEDIDMEEGAAGGIDPGQVNISNTSNDTPDFAKVGLGTNFQVIFTFYSPLRLSGIREYRNGASVSASQCVLAVHLHPCVPDFVYM